MAAYARKKGLRLRPHIKTHKCSKIAKLQIEAGAAGITVAKLGEAEVMVAEGIKDIFIAYPLIGKEKMRRLAALINKAKIRIAVDSYEGAKEVSSYLTKHDLEVEVMVIVDSGFSRDGVNPDDTAVSFVEQISKLPGLSFKGLMTHAGQVQYASNKEQVIQIGKHESKVVIDLADKLRKRGFTVEEISVGSTPASLTEAYLEGITEVRPGTYIFNDLFVVGKWSCTLDDCALTVLSTVVSRPCSNRIILDAGSKTLSSDRDKMGHGLIKNTGHYLSWLNEEHGMVNEFEGDLSIGTKVEIIPAHVCTTVNLAERLYLASGDEIVDIWEIDARGKVQ